MDTITNYQVTNIIQKMGGLGIIHRFLSIEEHRSQLNTVTGPKVACIGLGEEGIRRLEKLYEDANSVLIDVAHGHSQETIDQVRLVSKGYPRLSIIAGNVSTYEGASDLFEAGADCIKVGVGPGCLCTTRTNTGAGVPQLTAVMECSRAAVEYSKTIIADGGIKNAGDIVKALAAGADAVMIGGLLAGAPETPGDVFKNEGGMRYKIYRGMSSRDAQFDWKGSCSSVEGEVKRVPLKPSIESILRGLRGNILSGMSYQNARTLDELRKSATFIRQTRAGYIESGPHGL